MKKLLLSIGILMSLSVTSYSQLYFREDFTNPNPGWQNIDHDGDGQKWGYTTNPDDGQGQIATSASYTSANGALTPDNLLISPAIVLGSTNLNLSFKVKGQDPSYSQEHYAVYVSTTNDVNSIIATTPIIEETLPSGTQNYIVKTKDLSAYAGQTIYLTFRHYNVSDQFRINIDDIVIGSFEDVAMSALNIPSGALAGNIDIKGTIRNNGTTTINTVDLSYDAGSGPVNTQLTSLNLAPGATYNFAHPTQLNGTSGSFYNINVCASTTTDIDSTNNCKNAALAIVSQLVNKKVVVEEKTGTWCGWCPRGTVALDFLHQNQPKAIEIAVHNDDPMAISAYDSGTDNLPGFSGYPFAGADRVIGDDPSVIDDAVTTRLQTVPTASVSFGVISMSGNGLSVEAKINSVANLTGDYRVAVVLIEDSVKGTGSSWLQENYYSSTQANQNLISYNGVNWKTLPETVDQSTVFGGYNHVARALGNNQVNGTSGSLPSSIVDGQSYSYTYNFTYNPTWNIANMHAVAMFINKTTGEIINAEQTTLSQFAGVKDMENPMNLDVYPNPANDKINVSFDINNQNNVKINILDITGKVVDQQELSAINGKQLIQMNTTNLNSGIYFVNLVSDKSSFTQKVIISK